MNKVLMVHPTDNVMVALSDLQEGETVAYEGQDYTTSTAVKGKHKFALEDFAVGDKIYMYGVLVGKATQAIKKGEAITTENVKHAASDVAVGDRKTDWIKPDVSAFEGRTFKGYHRTDGQIGTQNVWLVVPLVFCENRNVLAAKDILEEKLGYAKGRDYELNLDDLLGQLNEGKTAEDLSSKDFMLSLEEQKNQRVFKNVDGIKFLLHDGGCGGIRQDAETLCGLLAGYLNNPNVAGATFLSLGCQNAQVEIMQEAIKAVNPKFDKPVYYVEQQKSASEATFVGDIVKYTMAGLVEANKVERKEAPISALRLGLECGGSDGFSGISANPVIGYVSDMLVALGAIPILAEFPELNGVEQSLTDRCQTEKDAKRFVDLMAIYKHRAEAVGSGFDANPSPGNIKDGLITDAMKSAGAAKKGGSSPIVEVLDYTEQVTKPGLNLLCTPGNDVESTTALAGSGATLITFSTGLGTPTGNPITPVIKVSSNTVLAERMKDIIDFNTGTVITGEDSIPTRAAKMLDYLLEVASGEAETNAMRMRQDDFIPWKRGISL
ncbi:UxaA family hydrolase [Flammeovirga yaeyamensis]|uniref:UxaA family hydrolase n=1 Tax=Flammeovirga yaeyamensis TaxID=367791 RepID=A0AAX1NCQ7_9BACT|nr:altronate dehydratase family protein [Flammeovirga yaeyamensis]MBB3699405.1 altronate hydrolase [Flammeovirga yaeyamensis]NMF35336.1 altronate dehydratase [Flammeovirga yaeyamensis]QWG04196.1 UxaA family hydrolase [Flammeovirga yaeyamensis]